MADLQVEATITKMNCVYASEMVLVFGWRKPVWYIEGQSVPIQILSAGSACTAPALYSPHTPLNMIQLKYLVYFHLFLEGNDMEGLDESVQP